MCSYYGIFTPYNVSSRQKNFLKIVSIPFAAEPSRIGILQKFVTMPRDTPWYAASEEYGIMDTWQKTYVSAVPPWCNGSTRVFGTLCLGSSPGGGAKRTMSRGLFRPPRHDRSESTYSYWHPLGYGSSESIAYDRNLAVRTAFSS